ncbi:MAG TPA: hypothetical protein VI564_03575 [Candidatus Nanoarchaeia archaeon]|nr:hypothetical protein [Candidatus Nanoarchaeia archaeon]
MAFFKAAKKSKNEQGFSSTPQPQMQGAGGSPIEQVLMMKQQGYTNNQIVQALQSQGYDNSSIFEAINQAGITGDVSFDQQQPMESGMPEFGQAFEPQPQQQPNYQTFQPPAQIQTPVGIDDERVQEIVEQVIEEKWNELAKDIQKVIDWKEKSEDRMSKIEQQILDLKLSMDGLTKSIMGKITQYDQNIVDVGTEIKAMEKVFQKVLPSMTENVNKLERMTKGYKDPVRK